MLHTMLSDSNDINEAVKDSVIDYYLPKIASEEEIIDNIKRLRPI
jgi:hypothetical protein